VLTELKETYRRFRDFQEAERKLTLQIKAVCRRYCDGDKDAADVLYKAVLELGRGHALSATQTPAEHPLAQAAAIGLGPLLSARDKITAAKKQQDQMLRKMARRLPIWSWAAQVPGFGDGNLAYLIGEAGDLSAYDNPAKLWKRFGLAVMEPVDGGPRVRQGAPGEGATAEDWTRHGYCPRRRSVAWNLASCLIRAGSPDYKRFYNERKEYERPRVESDRHAHNRALRWMTKRLLKDLWVAWDVRAEQLPKAA